MDAARITFLDKLLSPLPFLVWAPVVLLAALAALWAVDRFLLRRWDLVPAIRAGNVAAAIVVAVIVWAVVSIFARAAFGQTPAYDAQFRRWTAVHFAGAVDWRQFKAQAMTESALRPHVCSAAGACGLMQVMPATAAELGIDPFRPRQAIAGGIGYMRRLWRQWRAPRPPVERLAFAQVSYNAGLGNALRFQRRAAAARGCDANRYRCVEPLVWTEPRAYVRRIGRWCVRFGGWGCWRADGPAAGPAAGLADQAAEG